MGNCDNVSSLVGVLLWWVDKNSSLRDDEYQAGWKKRCLLVLLKLWQLFHGTSRSGATITAALYLGFAREAALDSLS